MQFSYRNVFFRNIVFGILVHLSCTVAHADDYYKTMKTFFADVMPGEAILPTPYGADSRFMPKSIWIYLDEYQARPDKPKRKNAWVVASNGNLIYEGVGITSSPINLPIRKSEREKKFAVTAALAGTISSDEFEAALELAMSEKLDLQIDLGETAIEYVNYFDMLIAQEEYSHRLDNLNALLKKRYGKETPKRRVVTAALKVKGARISINTSKSKSISASLAAYLSSLGFSYDDGSKTFDTLEFDGWRYIGYAARYTNDYGLISSGDDPKLDDSAYSTVPFNENLVW